MLFRSNNIVIKDFHFELPKETFTLPEWIEFVENHPEYLTVNNPDNMSPKAIALAINQGLKNIQEIMTPVTILNERLSRSEYVKNQKLEFQSIYSACLAAKNFEFIQEHSAKNEHFKLISDLLMIFKDNSYKIYVPPSMVGLLLSQKHLIGHKGLTRMLADLESYFFDSKYTVTRNFVNCC